MQILSIRQLMCAQKNPVSWGVYITATRLPQLLNSNLRTARPIPLALADSSSWSVNLFMHQDILSR